MTSEAIPDPDIRLYLLMRNDLPSMNPGKAIAHGAHAANQMVHILERGMGNPLSMETWKKQYHEWARQAMGFGTTISISMSLKEMNDVVLRFQNLGIHSELVTDPTYPAITDTEILEVMNRELGRIISPYADSMDHPFPTLFPEGHVTDLGNGKSLYLREEITCGFVFGHVDQIKPHLENFPLTP